MRVGCASIAGLGSIHVCFLLSLQGRARISTDVDRFYHCTVLQTNPVCPSRKNCGQTVDGTFAEYMVRCVAPIFPEPTRSIRARIFSQLIPIDLARVDKPCHPDSSLPRIPRCGSHSLRGIYSSSQSFWFVPSSEYGTDAVLIARAGSDCLLRPQEVKHNCRQLGCHSWCGRRIGSSRYARFCILFSGVQYGLIFFIYSHSVCSCHGFACPSHRYALLLHATLRHNPL